MIPTILAILLITSGCIAWYYFRHRHIVQLGIFFNLCAIAYFAFGMSIAMEPLSRTFTAQLEEIGRMALVAVIGFNLAYMISRIRPSEIAKRDHDYLPSHTTLLLFVGAGVAFELIAVLFVGFFDFFLNDRIERFIAIRPNTPLLYIANLLNVCLPIAIARYLKFRNQQDRNLFFFLLGHCIFIGIVTISRFDLSIAIICLCYFLERDRILRSSTIFIVLILSFPVTIFFKPLFYDVLLDQVYLQTGQVADINEYTNWIRHTILLMTRPEVELPHNGYFLALKSLFVISPEQDSLSEWFFQEFFPERAVLFPGLGYGFSGLWEGYSAYGLIGVGIHFAFFGAFFGLLERSPTTLRHIFIVFAIILTYRLFRSETYNFVKTYAWYFVYPTFAIVIIDKLMLLASRQRASQAGHLLQEVKSHSSATRPNRQE